MPRPRFLGVLLCYNDGDILADSIEHLLASHHDVVVWNHGSTDETASILERKRRDLLEVTNISRDVDFYDLYPLMSKHLRTHYVKQYDWVSWPDQDEMLEGPSRATPYREFLEEAVDSRHGWIEFRDFIFWFTERDDAAIASPCRRIRHYSLARHGAPKIRSWRASATNIRWFNHNKAEGSRYPVEANLRHYPMRSAGQMRRRVSVDRAGLQRGPVNAHYEHMKAVLPTIDVRAEDLHYDTGDVDLNPAMTFDWTRIYGPGPELPREVTESFLLSTRRWEIAGVIKESLGHLPAADDSRFGRDRIGRWLYALDEKISCPIVVALKRHDVKIVTEDVASNWSAGSRADDTSTPSPVRCVRARFDTMPVAVSADATRRSVRIVAEAGGTCRPEAGPPLVALVPCYDRGERPRVEPLEGGAAAFDGLRGTYYYLTWEPGRSIPVHTHRTNT